MSSIQYMLDTNTASYLIKNQSATIKQHLINTPISNVYISAITEAELLSGLAKKPAATQLAKIVHAFLSHVEILPWDSAAAQAYAKLRTACESEGKSLGNMDMLIAAHATAANMILVTNDKAFYRVSHLLNLMDWTKP